MHKNVKNKIKTQRSRLQRLVKIQKELILLLVAAVVLLSMVVFSVLLSRFNEADGSKRLVTFYDQGSQYAVLTRADTVSGALKAAAIAVDAHDGINPAIDSKLDASYVDVIIYRSRPVNVVDGSTRQTIMTVAQSPNEMLKEANLLPLGENDKTTFRYSDGTVSGKITLVVDRAELEPQKPVFVPKPNALTKSRGAHIFVDGSGVAHRETYYDLPMNIVIGACGAGGSYTIRSDGAKIDQDGYVLVAAGLSAYPRCTIVETSMGPGKVYDTGGFALRHPYGFDLATDWTNYDGR
jgi:hypothetical protein